MVAFLVLRTSATGLVKVAKGTNDECTATP